MRDPKHPFASITFAALDQQPTLSGDPNMTIRRFPPPGRSRENNASRSRFRSPSTRHLLEVKMTTMGSLAIIALLIGGTSPALAQNAPPTNGYPPPAAGASGNPATYGPPGTGVIPGAPGPAYSHRYRIVVPLTRRYGYQPYWWPQGQYHWSSFGALERWGFWCDGAGSHHISC